MPSSSNNQDYCHSHPKPKEATVFDKPKLAACLTFFHSLKESKKLDAYDERIVETMIAEDEAVLEMLKETGPFTQRERLEQVESRQAELNARVETLEAHHNKKRCSVM
jgi:hypothetical protein